MKDTNRPSVPPYLLLTVLPSMPMAFGWITGLFPPAAFRPAHDVNYVPHLFLAGGVLGVIVFAYAALQKRVDAKGVVRQGGAWVLAVLASAYLIFTATDHFMFFADKDASGIMSTELSRNAGIECAAPYLIARKVGRAFEYRCRTNIQLGHQFGQPFIPWPSYKEGTSEQLMTEYEKLEAEVARQKP